MGHWYIRQIDPHPVFLKVLYLQGLSQNQNLPRPTQATFHYLYYLLSLDHNYSWNELLTGNKIQLFCIQLQIRLMGSRRRTQSHFLLAKANYFCQPDAPTQRIDVTGNEKLRKWKYDQWPMERKLKSISLQLIIKWTLLLLKLLTIILKMIKREKSTNAATANMPRFGWVIWENMWKLTWE